MNRIQTKQTLLSYNVLTTQISILSSTSALYYYEPVFNLFPISSDTFVDSLIYQDMNALALFNINNGKMVNKTK
jgi:hypothetical protein